MFDQTVEIFRSELPEDVREVQLRFYYRNDNYERRSWLSRAISTDSRNRGPAFVRLRMRNLTDFNLDVEVKLITSETGQIKDLRISNCRIDTSDQAGLLKDLQTSGVSFCSIELDHRSAGQ